MPVLSSEVSDELSRIIKWSLQVQPAVFAGVRCVAPCIKVQWPAGWNTVGVPFWWQPCVSFKYQYSINRYFSESFALLDLVREGRKEVSNISEPQGCIAFHWTVHRAQAILYSYTFYCFHSYWYLFHFFHPFSHSSLIEWWCPEIQNPSNVFFGIRMAWCDGSQLCRPWCCISESDKSERLQILGGCSPADPFHLQLPHLVVKRHGIGGRFESEDSSHREMDWLSCTRHHDWNHTLILHISRILKLVCCWELCQGLKMNAKFSSCGWVRVHHKYRSRISISKMELDSWMEWICFASIV